MTEDFKLKYLKSMKIINRIAYALMLSLVLLSRGAELVSSNTATVYYCISLVIFLLCDEALFRITLRRFPTLVLQLRTYIFIIVLLIGSCFTCLPVVFNIALICLIFFLLIQDIIFGDVFNSFYNYIKYIGIGVVSGIILSFIQCRGEVKGAWLLLYVIVIAILGFVMYVFYDSFYKAITVLDDRYTRLYFRNADVIAENKKLLKFQERVEKVNSEINYQKINLTKANDDLAKINDETRSLIEVMKYFAASFDVEKNVHVMLENVVKIKQTGAAAIYLEKDIYMNDDPYLEVISENSVAETLLKQDIRNIYDAVRRRASTNPLVLCDNYDFKYPFLTGGNLCNAVAFPAYENDNIYGVMVITSSKYDFFENGYAFYESSLMDFTSALISDRLYLQTEDMAKKDGLTKIYNRIYFNKFYPELKEEVMESGDVFTVCMLDIDHFKRVNDTYGHLAGDEVIKAVARIDAEFAKKYDGTAVRYGGEEFLLILRGKGVEETYKILCDAHEAIKNTVVEYEDFRITINSSMGIACYPETCDNINDVLDKSDKAMYYSKEHGRGRITIDGREGET